MFVRVTVCELPDDPRAFAETWPALAQHVREARSQLLLLPELCFGPWFPRERPTDPYDRDPAAWAAVVAANEHWLGRLREVAPTWVLGSRPGQAGSARYNEGFIHEPNGLVRTVHAKRYLPDEPGFWEASWYDRGRGEFTVADAGPTRIGFLICTDLWFLQHARAYGQAGAQLIVNPRATELATVDKWLAAGRVAAVVAGAYCLSSNRVGGPGDVVTPMGGRGWIVSPDGEVLALTSPETPWVTMDIDLAEAERARKTYPRYVID